MMYLRNAFCTFDGLFRSDWCIVKMQLFLLVGDKKLILDVVIFIARFITNGGVIGIWYLILDVDWKRGLTICLNIPN